MGMGETMLFYLVMGVAVAVAVFVVDDRVRRTERCFRTATAVLFWPLFVPILLAGRPTPAPVETRNPNTPEPTDEIAAAVKQVQTELDAALASLDGWAEDAISRERGRLEELQSAWTAQANRIRDLDRLLAQEEFAISMPFVASHVDEEATDARGVSNRLRHSEQTRRQNIERLHQVRRDAYRDLMGTLAWVRELATMIHLAKYTGAPASRAEELVAQIAAAIEGLSEVSTWHDEPVAAGR